MGKGRPNIVGLQEGDGPAYASASAVLPDQGDITVVAPVEGLFTGDPASGIRCTCRLIISVFRALRMTPWTLRYLQCTNQHAYIHSHTTLECSFTIVNYFATSGKSMEVLTVIQKGSYGIASARLNPPGAD